MSIFTILITVSVFAIIIFAITMVMANSRKKRIINQQKSFANSVTSKKSKNRSRSDDDDLDVEYNFSDSEEYNDTNTMKGADSNATSSSLSSFSSPIFRRIC